MYIRRYTLKFWGKRRGILVTFIGPDGSGKSTLIYEVAKRLREIGLSCSTVYLGPWGQSILHLQKRFRWLNPSPYREDYKDYYTEKRNDKPSPLQGLKKAKLHIRSTLYYMMMIIEMWMRWLTLVLPKLRKGEVVIADRYIYDIMAGYKGLPMDYQIDIREKICDLYPRPDMGVFLESAPEIIVARKDQLTPFQLAHAIDAYRNIAKKYSFKILDTNRTIDSTLQDFEENLLPEVLVRIDRKKHLRSECL
jgi:thymidylate kinase